jgi:hypothetical protein
VNQLLHSSIPTAVDAPAARLALEDLTFAEL